MLVEGFSQGKNPALEPSCASGNQGNPQVLVPVSLQCGPNPPRGGTHTQDFYPKCPLGVFPDKNQCPPIHSEVEAGKGDGRNSVTLGGLLGTTKQAKFQSFWPGSKRRSLHKEKQQKSKAPEEVADLWLFLGS